MSPLDYGFVPVRGEQATRPGPASRVCHALNTLRVSTRDAEHAERRGVGSAHVGGSRPGVLFQRLDRYPGSDRGQNCVDDTEDRSVDDLAGGADPEIVRHATAAKHQHGTAAHHGGCLHPSSHSHHVHQNILLAVRSRGRGRKQPNRAPARASRLPVRAVINSRTRPTALLRQRSPPRPHRPRRRTRPGVNARDHLRAESYSGWSGLQGSSLESQAFSSFQVGVWVPPLSAPRVQAHACSAPCEYQTARRVPRVSRRDAALTVTLCTVGICGLRASVPGPFIGCVHRQGCRLSPQATSDPRPAAYTVRRGGSVTIES